MLLFTVTNSKNGREKKATPADATAKTGVTKTENAKSRTAELKSSVARKPSGRKPMKQRAEKTKPAPKVAAKDPPLNKRMPEFVGDPVAAVKPRNKLPPAVDVAAALAQPILRFQLTQRKPVRDLLAEVEEMAGVPIRYDEKKIATALEMRISITLEKVTVRQILEAIAAKADLAYRIERDGIRVVPASQGGK